MFKILCVTIICIIVLGDIVISKKVIKLARIQHLSPLDLENERRTLQSDSMEEPSSSIEFPERETMEIEDEKTPFGISPRIFSGSPISINETPWLVAFIGRMPFNNHDFDLIFCGGSIISVNLVLTAAHCFIFKNGNRRDGYFYIGSSNEFYPNNIRHEIENIIIHPNYRAHLNDIAIVRVRLPFVFNRLSAPNYITCSNVSPENFIGHLAQIAGWGAIQHTPSFDNDYLFRGTMKIISNDECNEDLKHLRSRVQQGQFCCKSIGSGKTCPGDSGGSLTKDGNLIGIQSGVFSESNNPLCNGYGVVAFTDVYYYLEWINRVRWENGS